MGCNSCKKKTAVAKQTVSNQSGFSLRELGISQIGFGTAETISNSNMSDELALKFLNENPNRISLFETFPANWKALLSDDKPQTEANESKSK